MISIVLLVAGLAVLAWWVLRDLARGQWMRPMIAVLALGLLAIRVIATFRPHRR